MEDNCGRKIDYLRISVTDLCNLRCKYCIPEKGIPLKRHEDILSFEEIVSIVHEAALLGITKVRITGGEPLVRKGIVDLVRMISQTTGIQDIALTTNGVLLAEMASALKTAGLQRVNVSLDSLDAEKYKQITRGGDLQKVIQGLQMAKEVGLTPIKINTVLIGGVNDTEIERFVDLTQDNTMDVRFIELMPIGEASGWSKANFISNNVVLERMPKLKPVPFQDLKSPARYYQIPGYKGKVGLINPISDHFCQNCNRMRLTSDGRLRPCLHGDAEMDIREALRTGSGEISEMIKAAIHSKPERHEMHQEDYEPAERNMYQIGG